MFIHKKTLRLFETDATGVLYFAQQLKMAQETFEIFLETIEIPLGESLRNGEYLLPVVRAEADFLAPTQVGDVLDICLEVLDIGTSSLTLVCTFARDGLVIGRTKIVHVMIARGIWKSMPIPEPLRQRLQAIQVQPSSCC